MVSQLVILHAASRQASLRNDADRANWSVEMLVWVLEINLWHLLVNEMAINVASAPLMYSHYHISVWVFQPWMVSKGAVFV